MNDTLIHRLCHAFGFILGLTIAFFAISFGANSYSSLPVAPSTIRTQTY